MTVSEKQLANKTGFSRGGLSPRIIIIPPSHILQSPQVYLAGCSSFWTAACCFTGWTGFRLICRGNTQIQQLEFSHRRFRSNDNRSDFPTLDGLAASRRALLDSSVSVHLEAAASDNGSWWNVEEAALALRFQCEIKIRDPDPESSPEWSESYSVSDFIRLVDKRSHSSFTVMLLPYWGCMFFPSLKRPFLPFRSHGHMLSLARVYFLKCRALCLRPVIEEGVTRVWAALQLLTYPDKQLQSADKIARRRAGARRSRGRLRSHVRISSIRCQKLKATLASFISLDCVRTAGG